MQVFGLLSLCIIYKLLVRGGVLVVLAVVVVVLEMVVVGRVFVGGAVVIVVDCYTLVLAWIASVLLFAFVYYIPVGD